MKKQIIGALSAITIFAIFLTCAGVVGSSLVDTGKASVVGSEDVWAVQVSLVEGPISWTHSVESKWAAQDYVKHLEADEPLGGYWVVYLNGIEYKEGRWHAHGK